MFHFDWFFLKKLYILFCNRYFNTLVLSTVELIQCAIPAIILNCFSVNNSSFGAAWASHWPMAALKEELWTEKQFKLMTGWHTVSSLLCVKLRHYYPVLLFHCLCYRINILKVLNLDIGSRVWHGRKIWYTNE